MDMSQFAQLDKISADFSNVCRICCNSKSSMVSIFTAHFSRKIMSLADIQVWESDGLPGQICNDCIVKLDVSFRFRKQCERSDYILRQKKAQIDETRNCNALSAGNRFELLECRADNMRLQQSNKVTETHQDKKVMEYALNPYDLDHHSHYDYNKDSLNLSFMDVTNLQGIKHDKSIEILYKCDVCLKVFNSKTKLSKHIPIHSGYKPYQCKLCKKSFTTNSNLKAHGKLHSEDRPFTCHICQKGCKRIKDLELHMRKHTGERPYGCDVCGKAFASSSNLRAHTRTHTGEKPYVCSVCQKSFCQSNELSKHRKIHMKEKRTCEICNKSFNGESALIVHMMSHNEEKTSTCNLCFKNFTSTAALAVHLQLHQVGEIMI